MACHLHDSASLTIAPKLPIFDCHLCPSDCSEPPQPKDAGTQPILRRGLTKHNSRSTGQLVHVEGILHHQEYVDVVSRELRRHKRTEYDKPRQVSRTACQVEDA